MLRATSLGRRGGMGAEGDKGGKVAAPPSNNRLWATAVLCVVTMGVLWGSISPRRVGSGARLTPEVCRGVEMLEVCSHRAAASTELEGVEDCSLEAVRALWGRNVSCFDVDFVMTSDDHLMTAHPDILGSALGEAVGWDPEARSFHELRGALARRGRRPQEGSFPEAKDIIALFAELRADGTGRDAAVFLDVKGRGMSEEGLQALASAVRAGDAARWSAVWFLPETLHLSTRLAALLPEIKLIWGQKEDRGDGCHNPPNNQTERSSVKTVLGENGPRARASLLRCPDPCWRTQGDMREKALRGIGGPHPGGTSNPSQGTQGT